MNKKTTPLQGIINRLKLFATVIGCMITTVVQAQCPNNATLVQSPAVFCPGDSITFEIQNITPNTVVVWDCWTCPGLLNSIVYTGASITIKSNIYTNSYRAVIRDLITGCTEFRYTNMQYQQPPFVSYGAGDTICAGGGFSLSLNSNAVSFDWSFVNDDTTMNVTNGMFGLTIGNGGKTLSTATADSMFVGKSTQFICTVTGTNSCTNTATFPVTVYAPRGDTIIVAPPTCVGDTISLVGIVPVVPNGPPVAMTSWNFLPDTIDLFQQIGDMNMLRLIVPNNSPRSFRFKTRFVCDNSAQAIVLDTATITPSFCGAQQQNTVVQTIINGNGITSKDSMVICFGAPFSITGTTVAGNTIRIINPSGTQYNGSNILTRSQVMTGASGWWRVQSRNGNTIVKTDSIFIGIRTVPNGTVSAPTTYCVGDTMTLSVSIPTVLTQAVWKSPFNDVLGTGNPALITFTGPGTHRVTVTDSIGCDKDLLFYINKSATPNWDFSTSNNYCCGSPITKWVRPNVLADSIGATYQWYHLDTLGNVITLQNGTTQFFGITISGATTNKLVVTPNAANNCGDIEWLGSKFDYCVVTTPGKCFWKSGNIESVVVQNVTMNQMTVNVDSFCIGQPVIFEQQVTTYPYQNGYMGLAWVINNQIIKTTPANSLNTDTLHWTPTQLGTQLIRCNLIANYCVVGDATAMFAQVDSCAVPLVYCDTLIVHDTTEITKRDTIYLPDSIPCLVHDTVRLIIMETDTFLTYDTIIKIDSVPYAVYVVFVKEVIPFPIRDTIRIHDTTYVGCRTDSFYILTTIVLRDTIMDTIPVGCQIEIYPNPTNDLITIYPPDPTIPVYDVYIYNLLGQQVYKTTLPQGIMSLYTETDLGLSAGEYIILLREHGGSKKFICKFIKLT